MKYNGNNLAAVLAAHKRWVNKEEGWTEDDKANFKGCYIKQEDLSHAILDGADFSFSCIFGSDLAGAGLHRANFENAHINMVLFHRADLTEANLKKAVFEACNFTGTFLASASAYDAAFSYCEFSGTDLTNVNFGKARFELVGFCHSDITKANFENSIIYEIFTNQTDLNEADNLPYIPMTCPEEGSFTAWKVCRTIGKDQKVIVKLYIPEDALRVSSTGRKCRTNKAFVEEIQDLEGNKLRNRKARSDYDKNFIYTVGKKVTTKFDENRFHECSSGIHFFINKSEAINYARHMP